MIGLRNDSRGRGVEIVEVDHALWDPTFRGRGPVTTDGLRLMAPDVSAPV